MTERREQIVESAIRALAREGPAATTRVIAAEAGVNVATLHYHFGGKDALVSEVMRAVTDQIASTLRAAIPTDAGVEEALEQALRAFWPYVRATRELQLLQYELTTSALRTEPALAREQYAAYTDMVADIVAETVAASGQRLAVPVDDLVRVVVAGVDGLILQALVAGDDADASAAVDRALDVFVRMVIRVADPAPALRHPVGA